MDAGIVVEGKVEEVAGDRLAMLGSLFADQGLVIRQRIDGPLALERPAHRSSPSAFQRLAASGSVSVARMPSHSRKRSTASQASSQVSSALVSRRRRGVGHQRAMDDEARDLHAGRSRRTSNPLPHGIARHDGALASVLSGGHGPCGPVAVG